MKNFSYFKKTAVLILWIPLVLCLFRFISDRQVAALLAGIGFIVLPTVILIHEIFVNRAGSKMIIISCIQFLILFAWPIFLLRVFNWGTQFNDILFLGISPMKLHQYSSWSYFLIVIVLTFQSFRDWRNKKRQP